MKTKKKTISVIVGLALFCATMAGTFGVSAQSGTWTTKAPMLEARVGMAAGVINGKLYLAGGSGGLTTLEIYDSASDAWAFGPGMATSRAAMSGGAINNKLYVAEGWSNSNSSTPTSALEIYDAL